MYNNLPNYIYNNPIGITRAGMQVMGAPSTYYSGWFQDWAKKKAKEKIEECKADPDACGSKLAELGDRLRREDCSKFKLAWRKKRCKERQMALQSDIDLIESINLPMTKPFLIAPSSSVSSSDSSAQSDGSMDLKTVGMIALGMTVFGLGGYYLLKGKSK